MIALIVMTDGRRDCIAETIASADEELRGGITRRLINDDSGDAGYRSWLQAEFGPAGFELIPPTATRQGFDGAIRHAWTHARGMTEPYVFHLEDDFTFNRPVDLDELVSVLDAHPHIVQMVLRRQAWNAEELAAGGVVEVAPHDFHEVLDPEGRRWLEHRRFFSTNPSLYRRSLLTWRHWPSGEHSEGVFTHQLLADDRLRFGYWGHRDDDPWVEHIGIQRAGERY